MTRRRTNEKCFSCNKVSPRAHSRTNRRLNTHFWLNANATRDVQMPVTRRWVPRPLHRPLKPEREKNRKGKYAAIQSVKVDRISNDMAAAELNDSRYMTNHNKEEVDEIILVTKSLVFGGEKLTKGCSNYIFFRSSTCAESIALEMGPPANEWSEWQPNSHI